MIKDSGERREFTSGAVRDIQEGKGRMDLLAMSEAAKFVCGQEIGYADYIESGVLNHFAGFMQDGKPYRIYFALHIFCRERGWDAYTALLEVAKHYEEGARKYDERNWERGIPTHCYVDSALRHYCKWKRGDADEAHDRAFIWNCFGLLWTIENKPECDDIPYKDKSPVNFDAALARLRESIAKLDAAADCVLRSLVDDADEHNSDTRVYADEDGEWHEGARYSK